VQGYDPTLDYSRLAEAALAVRAGALWVVSNADATVPTERGLLPGNGSLVALVRTATGGEPLVVGKPELAMHEESVRRSRARRPLIVGDRLDTDVEAGVRANTPTLLVLTGVASPRELFRGAPQQRPTYVSADLRGLLRPHPATRPGRFGSPAGGGAGGTTATCGSWICTVRDGVLAWERTGDTGPDAVPGGTGLVPGGTGLVPGRGGVERTGGARGGPAGGLDDPPGVHGVHGAPRAGRGVEGGGEAVGDDGLDALRAACLAGWLAADSGEPVRGFAGDPPAGCEDLP
jgi:hypothetical protein